MKDFLKSVTFVEKEQENIVEWALFTMNTTISTGRDVDFQSKHNAFFKPTSGVIQI